MDSSKTISNRDFGQTLRFSFNEEGKTLGVDGFLAGKVGHSITRTLVNSTTEDYSYFDNGALLMTFEIIYTDSSLGTISSVTRTA